jgi:hypothetical protein
MRNIVQYPITREEISNILDTQIKKQDGLIGSVAPVVLSDIKRALEDNPELYEQIFKHQFGYDLTADK